MRIQRRWYDRPLPRLQRTPRELFVIGVAAATAVRFARIDPGGSAMFAIAAAAFAARFFAARVIAMGVAIAAAATHATGAITPGVVLRPELLGIAYFLTGVLILRGRALVEAFDDGPSRGRLLHNFWRDLPAPDRRSLARVAYGVGVTGAMVFYARSRLVEHHHAPPVWLTVAIVGAAATGVLLVAGRAVAALVATLGAGALAVVLGARLPAAIAVVRGGYVSLAQPALARDAGALVIGGVLAAAFTTACAAPWAWRLLRHHAG